MFTEPGVPGTFRTLYRVIHNHWKEVQEEDQLGYDLLETYAEQVKELDLGDNLDKLLQQAVNNHALSRIFIDAQRDLVQTGSVDLNNVVSALRTVETTAAGGNRLELFDPDALANMIGVEANCRKYPTKFPSMDKMLNGGSWESELVVLLGEVHLGKTWSLTYKGSRDLLEGIPVIHFTGEITKPRSYIRYYQSLLGLDRFQIMTNPIKVGNLLKELELPPWCIVDFSNRAYSVHQLRHDVLRFCDEAGESPLIIVDYIDKLKSGDRRLEGRFALADITEYLRRIACEVRGSLWTASQIGRAGYGEMYVRMENVAEAISKVEIADIIITLNQTEEERQFNQMRWLVEKARERTLPPRPETVLRCMPEIQSFEENVQASQDQFNKWAQGET
jgi:replicative DNA helicase